MSFDCSGPGAAQTNTQMPQAGEPYQSTFTESTPHQKINLETNIAAGL